MGLATSWYEPAAAGPGPRIYPVQVVGTKWIGHLDPEDLWPDDEFPFVRAAYRLVRAPRLGEDAPLLIAEVDDARTLGDAAADCLGTLTPSLFLAGPRVDAAAVAALPRHPRLLRVVEERDRSLVQFLEAASQALEVILCSAVCTTLFERCRCEANHQRVRRFLLDTLPPWPGREVEARLQLTLWAHVHGVAGFGFPGPTQVERHLGVCAQTLLAKRRAIPAGLVEALRPGGPAAGEPRPEPMARTFEALEDALHAQAYDWLGDPSVELWEAERRALVGGLEAVGGCLAAARRRLAVDVDRLRRVARNTPVLGARQGTPVARR